jgi:tetratricopeptide (TPR) repeat protein
MKPLSPFERLAVRPLRATLALLAIGLLAGSPALAADEEDDQRSGRTISARDVDPAAAKSAEFRAAAKAKRLEAINRLKGLLNSPNVDGDRKAEMMLRLADLYFAQGRDIYFSEMEQFDAEYDKCFNTDGCPVDSLKPDNRASRQWQERSIKLYQNILKSYPTYARADQATFFLGSAQTDIGQTKAGVSSFKRLIKLYPDSSFKTDALILIGEYYFDQNEAFPALKAYLMASQDETHEKNGYARYRLGWCYYNVGEYDKAIDSMKRVINASMAAAESDKAALQLQDEALKDLVRFFADASMMNEAYDYFKSLGKDDLIKKTLKRLASQYYENGQYENSIDTYRRLILEDPQEIKNPSYQGEIIKAYVQLNDKGKTLEEIDRLLRDYGKDSAWARANASNPKAVEEAQESVEKALRKVATDYHTEARKLRKSRHPTAPDVYSMANQAYAAYLTQFPATKNAYDMRYSYGELLYEVKDYAGAFEQYMKVVEMDPKGQYSKYCAESAIFAAEEQVKLEGGIDASSVRVNAGEAAKKEAIPLTDWEKRLVAACKQFADLYPEDKKVIQAIFKSAYLLYTKFQFSRAAEQFNAVINMNPSSSQATTAAELMLDTFVVQENYEELKKNAKFYYDMKGLGNSKFKQETFEIYENASFKLIEEDLKKDSDKSKAADRFIAFYEEFPTSKNAALALNNASIYLYEENRVADAVKVRHILVDDPKFGPKTEYYYSQIAALGFDYEQIANYDKAAFYYEKLFSLHPKEVEDLKKSDKDDKDDRIAKATQQANDALYSAAVFRTALGETDKGIDNYNTWMSAFSDDERVPDVQLTVGKTYESEGQWDKAADIFSAFYTKNKDAPPDLHYFARLHHGQALEKLGKERDQKRLYESTVKKWQKEGSPPQATEFVAEMMYMLAQPKLDAYMDITLSGQGRSLVNNLKKKTQSLQQVQTTFTEIVETGAGEWGVASLVSLGKAYSNMAAAFRESEKPNELTQDQLEIYTMQLEDKAYVQDEKAIAAYKLALETAYKFTLYNDDTAFANAQLGVLRPNEYPAMTETLLEPDFTSKAKGRSFNYENEME